MPDVLVTKAGSLEQNGGSQGPACLPASCAGAKQAPADLQMPDVPVTGARCSQQAAQAQRLCQVSACDGGSQAPARLPSAAAVVSPLPARLPASCAEGRQASADLQMPDIPVTGAQRLGQEGGPQPGPKKGKKTSHSKRQPAAWAQVWLKLIVNLRCNQDVC